MTEPAIKEEIRYLLDHPTVNVTLAELFNFGGHEAQDQRDVDSYKSYTYTPGWYNEDDSTEWWNEDWAREIQAQTGPHGQPQVPPQRPARRLMPPPATGSSIPIAAFATTGPQRVPEGMQAPLRGRTLLNAGLASRRPRQVWNEMATPERSQGVSYADLGPLFPHMHTQHLKGLQGAPMRAIKQESPDRQTAARPATVPSTPAQPSPAGPVRMPEMNPSLPKSRLRPPAGFNDQPPPRVPPDLYLPPHHERPKRNVQWPMNIEISMVEICTFGPSWFMLPECIGRAIRNGWSREALAKAQLYAEDPDTRDAFATRYGRIQKQISQGGKILDGVGEETRFNSDDFRFRHGMQNDLTANSWRFKNSYVKHPDEWLGDVPLSDVYAHVVNWPTGNDRMLMTQCLEFARDHPERKLDTSQWEWIISSQGFTAPPPLANGEHRDVEALQRVNQMPNPQ